MRTPQAHEAKARITEFLAKVRAGKGATVIRHNRGVDRMARMGKAIREAQSHAIARALTRGSARRVSRVPADCGQSPTALPWCYRSKTGGLMSATTTLKLPDDLKARIAIVAEQTGKTPHAFMVEALRIQTELAERRREFVQSARLSEQEVAEYGLVYDADEVFSYLRDRLAGRPTQDPKTVKL